MDKRICLRRTSAILAAGLLIWAADAFRPARAGFGLEGDAPPVLSITDATGAFTLTFDDFTQGSVTNQQTVVYRVQANVMSKGKIKGAVSAQTSAAMKKQDGIVLEADVLGYRNLGESNFAVLEEGKKDFLEIKDKLTHLADKLSGKGSGDMCLDGELRVGWRARLTRNMPAEEIRVTLVVTLFDDH